MRLAQEQFAKGKVMEDQKNEGANPPQSIDEFVEQYAPRFAKHPGELVMAVERDDDDGFRGGPGMNSPLPSTKGMITSVNYFLAVIDSGKVMRKESMSVTLPVGPYLLVHIHGMHTLDEPNRRMGVSIIELAKMSETLLNCDMKHAGQRFPAYEIFVGDAEVAGAMEMVEHERELVAIVAAARKLGRPITASTALTAALDAKINELVAALVRVLFGPKPKQLCRSAIVNCLNDLAAFDIDIADAAQRCLGQLLSELKNDLRIAT